MTAQRTKDWNEFAAKVADHIENYTVPQYGDAPNDNVESWSFGARLYRPSAEVRRTFW